jgi:hypothetical protein
MKIARLALALLVTAAMSLVLVSAASATEPLFTPVGASVLAVGGLAVLLDLNRIVSIHCEKSISTGTIQNTLLLGNVVLHYLECTSSSTINGSGCPVHSPGAAEGLILTNTLHGILGLILPSKGTGVLFLPESGKVFVDLEMNACTNTEIAVSGNVAALIEPVGESTTKGNLLFEREAGPGNSQEILDIDLTHGLGLVAPKLTEATEGATLTQLELLTFSDEIEVT